MTTRSVICAVTLGDRPLIVNKQIDQLTRGRYGRTRRTVDEMGRGKESG